MATVYYVLATADVGSDHAEVRVYYDDVDLEIQSVSVDFTGEAHFKIGNPAAKRLIIVTLDEPLSVVVPPGYYLLDTEDGLEIPPEFDYYIVLNLYAGA